MDDIDNQARRNMSSARGDSLILGASAPTHVVGDKYSEVKSSPEAVHGEFRIQRVRSRVLD